MPLEPNFPPAPKLYNCLDDAAQAQRLSVLRAPEGSGNVKIWYLNDAWRRTFCDGYEQAKSEGVLATKDGITMVSHSLVGEVHCDSGWPLQLLATNRDAIFIALQGENWSPNGEARGLLGRKGLTHTSMSTGDVLEVGGLFFMRSRLGWDQVGQETKLERSAR